MKRKSFLFYAGIILALAFALAFTGCPTEPDDDPEFDSNLVGTWTNDPGDAYTTANYLIGLEKTFTISANHTFTAGINPTHIETYLNGEQTPAGGEMTLMGAVMATAIPSDADSRWTVTGSLDITEDEVYVMNGLAATSPGNDDNAEAAAGMSGQSVRIRFTDDDTFVFESYTGIEAINTYFGGEYHRVQQ